MHGQTKAEMLDYHHRKMVKLMETTHVSNDTVFNSIDEATAHLIHHFEPKDTPEQSRDHCLLIGQAYFGKSVENEKKNVSATAVFIAGDVHQLSHTIADNMVESAVFRQVIIYALEVYNKLPKPGQQN